MRSYAVFGLGRMGEAIVYDLLEHDRDSLVTGYEYSQERIAEVKERFSEHGNRLVIRQFDIEREIGEGGGLATCLEGIDVAFGAIDYRYNRFLTECCIKNGVHFLDLGGNPEVVRSQKEMSGKAEEEGVTVIPDCGLAPGMADVLAAIKLREFTEVEECHIRVGGLPKSPSNILKYQQLFSIRGLTNEYIEKAIILRNGEITEVESLTEVEEVVFPEPFGVMEAFHTAGGTSSLPELYEGKIKELTYKTIRYKGHVQFFQFLKDFGMLNSEPIPGLGVDPRRVVEWCLENHLPQREPDVTLVKITIVSSSGTHSWIIIDEYDEETGFSSMARMTAFPISILGQMIARGEINSRGVVSGEEVTPGDRFIEELEKRNIILKEYSG